MKAGTKPLPGGITIKRLRVLAFGLAFLLVAMIVGGVMIGLTTVERLRAIQSEWLEFRQITANRGQSLNHVRNFFSVDGFIHDFQKYVSQRDITLAGVIERDIDELLAALATYEVVGVADAERAAIADIRMVAQAYRANLAEARRMVRAGAGGEPLLRLADVDHRPAIAALATLEVNWLEKLDAETKNLTTGISTSEQMIKLTVIFVPILALTVVVLLWFMRRLVQVTVETMRADQVLRESEERNRLFAADVAHELRTPLAVMRLHLEKLADPDTARSLLQDVEKIARMLDQLLATAKLEDPNAKLTDGVNLHEICVEVGADMAPLAIKEGRSIEVRGPERPVLIRANRFAIEQAVRNLVENSIKYAARNTKVVIEVQADTELPAIKVTDKGPGIPAEKREAIFDPFLRSDRRSGGAGLGLSIVRRVAEVHDATIEIADAPGGGSVFTIAFPRQAPLPGA